MMRSFEHPKGLVTSLPSHIIFGQGTLARLPALLASYGSVRPLVVTTPGSSALGQRCVDLVATSSEAERKAIRPSLLAKAKMHSPVDVSEEAAKLVDEGGHDAVVAVGGGSAIGLGKALASRRELKAFVAIPTTYSGSECTMTLGQTSTDPKTGEQLKTTSKSPRFLATAVIFDVNLTMTLPASVTATSAMNALAHAVEGLYAKEANDETRKLALESIAAFRRALPALAKNLDDVDARDEALYGALMAGECLGAVSMGLHHKLCHVLGGTFDMPHSPTHTVILPHATLYNASHAPEAMAQMAEALGVLSPAAVPGALFDLAAQNGAPTSLRELGLPESAIPRAAEIACTQSYPNPRPMEKEAIEQLLRDAWEGKRPAGGLLAGETMAAAAPASSTLAPEAVARALPDAVPENAPAHCPGTDSDQAGKASACEGCPNQNVCASTPKGPDPDLPKIKERMRNVRNKVLIMSGKGGVGKSTFTAMLGWACARDEKVQTAIMDIDICGPSIPTILGLTSSTIHSSASGWSPVFVSDNLCAMSIGFLLPSTSSAVIWRGPKKNGLIKQFLLDVDWTGGLEEEDDDESKSAASESKVQGSDGEASGGALDYMLIDTPPGTSDEHLSIVSYLKESGITGAVLLTTPQEVSLQDVRKEISFCRKVGVPILGVVENMAGFVCPSCHGRSDIFYPSTGGAKALCQELDLEFLGSVPLDPRIGKCCDLGLDFVAEFPESPASLAYLDVIARVKELCAAASSQQGGKAADGRTA